jgi:hypothetical protein
VGRVCRPGLDVYIVFGVIAFLPAYACVESYVRGDAGNALFWLAAFVVYCAAVLFWLSRFVVVLEDSKITYRSLLGGTRYIEKSHIESATYSVGQYGSRADWFAPYHRLIITPTMSSGRKPLVINVKVFRKPDVDALFQYVRSVCPIHGLEL